MFKGCPFVVLGSEVPSNPILHSLLAALLDPAALFRPLNYIPIQLTVLAPVNLQLPYSTQPATLQALAQRCTTPPTSAHKSTARTVTLPSRSPRLCALHHLISVRTSLQRRHAPLHHISVRQQLTTKESELILTHSPLHCCLSCNTCDRCCLQNKVTCQTLCLGTVRA